MLVNKGDKIKLKVPFGIFNPSDIGKEYCVSNIENDGSVTIGIEIQVGDELVVGYCTVSATELDKYFEMEVEKVPVKEAIKETTDEEMSLYLTENERFNNALYYSEICSFTVFNKTTVVAVRFPNNYVIVESSSCVKEDDYDEALGIKLCMKRIEQKYIEHIAFESCDDISDWDSLVEYEDDDEECDCCNCDGGCDALYHNLLDKYNGILTKENCKDIINAITKSSID